MPTLAPPVIITGNRFNIVDQYHKSLGWGSIGYHYFIEVNGELKQGRQDNEEGAHTIGRNNQSLGICLANNFDLTMPTEAQITTLKKLLIEKTKQYNIPASNIVPHRFFATQTLQGKPFIKNDTEYATWDGCKPYKSCYGSKLSDNWARNLIKDIQEDMPVPNIKLIECEKALIIKENSIQSLLKFIRTWFKGE